MSSSQKSTSKQAIMTSIILFISFKNLNCLNPFFSSFRFIEASASIAAYECLEVETRLKYFNHLIQSAKGTIFNKLKMVYY